MLRLLHFRHRINWEKKLPTLQIRCYKDSWGGKMTATQSSTIPLSVLRLKEYSFTLFHHVFWKRAIFGGVPVLELLELLVPMVHLGVKKMRKKKFFKGKPIWPFPFEICEPTLSDMRKSKITHPHPHHHNHSRQREPPDEFMFGLGKKLLTNQELACLLLLVNVLRHCAYSDWSYSLGFSKLCDNS